jgi:hypothetical protein
VAIHPRATRFAPPMIFGESTPVRKSEGRGLPALRVACAGRYRACAPLALLLWWFRTRNGMAYPYLFWIVWSSIAELADGHTGGTWVWYWTASSFQIRGDLSRKSFPIPIRGVVADDLAALTSAMSLTPRLAVDHIAAFFQCRVRHDLAQILSLTRGGGVGFVGPVDALPLQRASYDIRITVRRDSSVAGAICDRACSARFFSYIP